MLIPANALFYDLCYRLLHISALLFRHLQGADTKISLKNTAVKYVTIIVHVLWYQ